MSDNQTMANIRPLTIIGVFWTLFGIFILIATFFVEGSTYVTAAQGRATNLISAALLLTIGIVCLVRGRKKPQE